MADTYDVLVIGAGITGLAAAYEITSRAPRLSLALLEKSDRVGGIVGSYRYDGFTVDTGPHGFVVYGPGGVAELAERLGLGGEMAPARDAAQQLYLLSDDTTLHKLPTSIREFLRTPLLSWRGKVRAAAEVCVPRSAEEEAFYYFVARRFGPEMARQLAVPAVLGVTGGDSRTLSVDAKFPFIRQLERNHRSILLGALRTGLAHQRASGRRVPRLPNFREFGMRLHSFRAHGMQLLVDALEKQLGDAIRLGAAATGLTRCGAGDTGDTGDTDASWRVRLGSGEVVPARHVLLALPAHATARLLAPLLPEVAAALAAIPHPDVRVVGLGYRRADLAVQPDGIGFLTIPTERTRILGTIHTSTIFPEQAPEGTVLIRTLAGGVQDPAFSSLPTAEAVAAIHADLARVFGIRGRPVFSFDHLWRQAIPEYQIGHRSRVATALAAVAELGGVHLAGNTFHGVGVNDCVRDARRAAQEILSTVRSPGG